MKSFVQTSWQSAKKSIADTDKIRKKKSKYITTKNTIKSQKKTREKERNKRFTKQMENNEQNSSSKLLLINNYIKYKMD